MTIKITALFVCAIEENTMIMCEPHAQAFELVAMTAQIPHTIIEMDLEDAQKHECMACDLEQELTRPKIILPGQYHWH